MRRTFQFLLTDQVGTLRAVADSAGMIVKRIDYDSFGNIIADSNPSFTVPFGFAGGLHDRDTGLVRFGYRDYSPELGRFVAKDPIDFAGGDTNLYAYAMNDPVNGTDALGLRITRNSNIPPEMNAVINRVAATSTGAAIYKYLDDDSASYEIVKGLYNGEMGYLPNTMTSGGTTFLSMNSPQTMEVSSEGCGAGRQPASIERIVAHELAETYWGGLQGYSKAHSQEMAIRFENAIAHELGVDKFKRIR